MLASADFGLSWILEVVAFVAVFWVIIFKFPVPQIRKAMDQRREVIRSQLSAGEEARAAGERLVAECREALEASKAEAARFVEEARSAATSLVEDGRRRAEVEYERIVERADLEIELELTRLRTEVTERVGAGVAGAVRSVVEVELNESRHHRLIGEAIAAAEAEQAV